MCVAAAASRGAPEKEIDWVLVRQHCGRRGLHVHRHWHHSCACVLMRRKTQGGSTWSKAIRPIHLIKVQTMMQPMGVAAVPPLQPARYDQHHHGGASCIIMAVTMAIKEDITLVIMAVRNIGITAANHQGQSYYDAQSFYPDNGGGATGQFQTGQFQPTVSFKRVSFKPAQFPSNDNFYGSQTSQPSPPPPMRPPPTFSSNPYGDHNAPPPQCSGAARINPIEQHALAPLQQMFARLDELRQFDALGLVPMQETRACSAAIELVQLTPHEQVARATGVGERAQRARRCSHNAAGDAARHALDVCE
jgi:hypothetical protein